MVDTGATYSMVPTSLLRDIGITPTREAGFRLADGTRQPMQIGNIQVTINESTSVCPVVFGPDDASPLIGAVTLEALLLTVDPIERRLVATDGLLL